MIFAMLNSFADLLWALQVVLLIVARAHGRRALLCGCVLLFDLRFWVEWNAESAAVSASKVKTWDWLRS